MPLQTTFAILRAQNWNYWTSHWQTSGNSFYGDHLLFQRLYEDTNGEIDSVAERLVGLYGSSVVNPNAAMTLAHSYVTEWEKESNLFLRGLHSEEVLLRAIEETIDEGVSHGLSNLLEGIADKHENHQYLLKQRIKDLFPKMNPFGKTANLKSVETPYRFSQVRLEAPQIERYPYPFMGFIDFQGMSIDVENAAGSIRKGEGWKTYMHHHYGEIRGFQGTDGDPLDVYIGLNHDSPIAVIIHQHDLDTGQYDEDKVMLGFDSVEEAIGAYKKQYDRPGFYVQGDYTAIPVGSLHRWLSNLHLQGKRIKLARRY